MATALLNAPSFRRGAALLSGVAFGALPTVGPLVAALAVVVALLSKRFSFQRADPWWWLAAILLGVPFLFTGHPTQAALTVVHVLAVWVIYRATEFVSSRLRNQEITRLLAAGFVLGLLVTLAVGAWQMPEARLGLGVTSLEESLWNIGQAPFGHVVVVLSAALALLLPSPRLRFLALALGAGGVLISGSHEAVWAWLIVALGLRIIKRREPGATALHEWALIGVVALYVTGVASLAGLGRTGSVVTWPATPDNANMFRATEATSSRWWLPLGVSYSGHVVNIAGNQRVAFSVAKTSTEPWSRLQQTVVLAPSQTYTLSAVIQEPAGWRPGFEGWGSNDADSVGTTMKATLEEGALRVATTGPISVVSTDVEPVDGSWQRLQVTFKYLGSRPLTWYLGVVPDRSSGTGAVVTFAELQLRQAASHLPYQPGDYQLGVTDIRSTHVPAWRDALTVVAARPLQGWGANGFEEAVSTLLPSESQVRPVAKDAHNAFLDTWVDRGIVGVAGLLALVLLLGLRAIQLRDQAAALVIGAVLVLNVFDNTLLSGAVAYPLAALLGWRAASDLVVAKHETGPISALFTRLTLAVGDYLTALLAFGASYLVVGATNPQAVAATRLEPVLYLAAAWPLLNWALGQYPGYGRPSWQEMQRSVGASLGAGFLVILVGAVLGGDAELHIEFLGVAILFATLAAPAGRAVTKFALRNLHVWGRPVLVVGEGGSADNIATLLLHNPRLGLRPVALIDEQPQAELNPHLAELHSPRLTSVLASYADHVIVVPGESATSTAQEILSTAGRFAFRTVQVVPGLLSVPSNDVVAKPLGRTLSLQVRNNLAYKHNRVIKRTLEAVAVAVGAVVAVPLLAAIAVAIRLDSPGPAFFRQRRIGQDGKPFHVWKFRTMVVDAQERLEELLVTDPAVRREWEETQKLVHDPRVTRVGHFLRITSLDELPQLFNVVKGEMSLVEPRPLVEREIEKYKDDYRYYTQVRPGITGLWQVSGRSDTDYDFRVELDTYYVRNWSLWIDLDILVKTVGVVLKRQGAY